MGRAPALSLGRGCSSEEEEEEENNVASLIWLSSATGGPDSGSCEQTSYSCNLRQPHNASWTSMAFTWIRPISVMSSGNSLLGESGGLSNYVNNPYQPYITPILPITNLLTKSP